MCNSRKIRERKQKQKQKKRERAILSIEEREYGVGKDTNRERAIFSIVGV